MAINYVKGDATEPQGDGTKIIVHVCNDIGGWGRGFVVALSNKWDKPERYYRGWHKHGELFELGRVQIVQVEDDVYVANIIGQHDVRPKKGLSPVRYDAIEQGLRTVAEWCVNHQASIHGPRFGSGLAGGDWDEIERRIVAAVGDVPVTIYDL